MEKVEPKVPNGADLLKTLIELYAKQEGVKITYEIVRKDGKQHGK